MMLFNFLLDALDKADNKPNLSTVNERAFPVETTAKFIRVFEHSNLPIVSVGSGNGKYEWNLKNKQNLGHLEWILVDPEPESFRKYDPEEKIVPDFSVVPDLIAARPSIVGNCILFLCWPTPCESRYDIDAIRLLQPQVIVLMYETIGGAGGNQMHHWLNLIGESDSGRMIDGFPEKIDTDSFPLHRYVSQKKRITKYHCQPWIGLGIDRILVLTREDCRERFDLSALPDDEEIDTQFKNSSILGGI